jgi:hypothetical protein
MTPPAKVAAVTAAATFGHQRSGQPTNDVPGAAYGPHQLGMDQLGPFRSERNATANLTRHRLPRYAALSHRRL